MNIDEIYDVEYLKKKWEETKALADALGLSVQETLLFRMYLSVDSIDDKLDDLSVTTYEAPNY